MTVTGFRRPPDSSLETGKGLPSTSRGAASSPNQDSQRKTAQLRGLPIFGSKRSGLSESSK